MEDRKFLYSSDIKTKDDLQMLIDRSANNCPALDIPTNGNLSRICPLAHEIRNVLKGTKHEIDHKIFSIKLPFRCGSYRDKKRQDRCPIEEAALDVALKLLEDK